MSDDPDPASAPTVPAKPATWNRLAALFHAASELLETERAAYLERACPDDPPLRAEVAAMLANADPGDSLRDVVAAELPHAAGDLATTLVGSRIGAYRLIELLGEGGMSFVYLATREDAEYKHDVAIKILKHGLQSQHAIARFRDERQILATLDHPGIVRLLDGATSEHGPYLVLERVHGVPLTSYAAEHRLSVRAKLELILRVCTALQFAHDRTVVHRDLKPSNILVEANGAPKLLDFGIAKLLEGTREAHTQTGVALLTFEYASPEQASGESVSVATDVYSLGVVLYELLTGKLPLSPTGSQLEKVLTICKLEPRLASVAAPELARELEGDLDNILAKALHKEPAQRYGSIEKLAEDLRAHLEGLPVTARTATFGYRAAKFVHRNRIKLAIASAVVIALTIATAVSIRQARRAEAAAQRARERFEEVRLLANWLLFEIDDAIRDLAGTTHARTLVVTRALTNLDRLATEPDHDPSLSRELAVAYMKIGDIQGSPWEPSIGRPRDGLLGRDSRDLGRSLLWSGAVGCASPGKETYQPMRQETTDHHCNHLHPGMAVDGKGTSRRPRSCSFAAALLLASACVDGIDETDVAGAAAPADHGDGTLLAEATVSSRHQIRLYELPEGGVAIQELAHEDEPSLLRDWNGHGSVLEYLRGKLPDWEIPTAAVEAERTPAADPPRPPSERPEREQVPGEGPPPAPPAAGLAAVAPAPSPEPVLTDDSQASAGTTSDSSLAPPQDGPASTVDWAADAAAWSAAYCQSSPDGWGNAISWFDGIWCPTNVGTAISDSRPTVDFEARGKNASFTAGATHWLERRIGWTWLRLRSQSIAPRYHSLWLVRGNGTYRSGMTGERVHASVRHRRQMPVMTQLADYPSDFSGWSHKLSDDMQGVANDGSNWYMTNTNQIAKWPVSGPLGYSPSLHYGMPAPWASRFDHMGDLVYANGYLYVPLEGDVRAIGVFNTNLQYVGYAVIDQAHAGWLAYNPRDGLFYSSSDFYNVSCLNKWQVTVSGTTVTAVWKGSVSLVGSLVPIRRLQGGEFSAKGNLYATSDADGGGLLAIDVLTGLVAARTELPFDTGDEELEGVTIWNLDGGQAPGIAGQIHVQLLDNDRLTTDEVYLKHLRVSSVGDL